MRPSSRLPRHILLSMLGVTAACLLGIAVFPHVAVPLLVAGIAATLAGAFGVALAAAERRRHPGPAGWILLADGVRRDPAWPRGAVWAAGIAAITLAVMTSAAAPGLYVKDAGELVASVRGLGVPHPTGFAAFCLVGKAFDLLPAGGGAFRVNLLSVVSIAFAAAMAFLVAMELGRVAVPGRDRWSVRLAAVTAALALPASHLAWLHGTTTEVYAFSLAGMAAAIAAYTFGATRQDARWLALGAFATGLGLGGHVTWPLYAGLSGLVATAAFLAVRRRAWGVVGVMAVAGLLGAAVVAYLPAVASRGPYMNWGDPSDAPGVLAHLTGARIRAAFQDRIGGVRWPVLWTNLVRSLAVLADGSIAVAPLAAAGAVLLGVFRPLAGAAAVGLVVADVLFSARINPMGIVDLQTLLPTTWFVAVLAGVGVVVAARRMPRLAVPAAIAGLALAGVQAAIAPADRDMTGVTVSSSVIGSFLDGLEPGATVLTSSDNLSSGLAGLQVLESPRPDVLPLVKQHLSDTAYVRSRLAFHHGAGWADALGAALGTRPFESGGETPAQGVARAVELAARRGPVWLELGEGRVDRPLYPVLEPGFPAFAVRPGAVFDPAATVAVAGQALQRVPEADRWGRSWLAGFLRTTGTWASARGDDVLARRLTAQALQVAPDDARSLYNLGILIRAGGDEDAAMAWFQRAAAADPGYLRAWEALERSAQVSGRADVAGEASDRVRALRGEAP